jgi:glutamyl-tRNA reductase
MVLGESQIMAQVKEAYLYALDSGFTDMVINTLFQRALYVGKKVRFNTGIDQHSLSIGVAAVELAEKMLGDLNDKKVLIIRRIFLQQYVYYDKIC